MAPKIATLGSHSALQILHGAHQEGFETIVVCRKGHRKPYEQFPVADRILDVDDFADLSPAMDVLVEEDAILIPHGSLLASTGGRIPKIDCMYFGSKAILEWESNRTMEREWLARAGLRLPLILDNPSQIDRSVIVKFHGAEGGKGYFVANSPGDFENKIVGYEDREYVLQEYIIGVPIYIHYFYSRVMDRVEIMGFDKRYESNVDSLGRISARDQIALKKVDPSYVIVGNIPLVLRESFLTEAIKMGEDVVRESLKNTPKGLFGPFCLETIMTPEKEFYTFEISARIVAGTNPYVSGSPYTDMMWNEPMSTGRRIAREIRMAIEQDRLDDVLDGS